MSETKTNQCASNIALFAPIPIEHLITGRTQIEQNGKVAFGSQNFELFRRLDIERNEHPVDVYIYASWMQDLPEGDRFWIARYIGHVDSDLGAHPSGMKYRPFSTSKYANDNSGFWAIFWEIDKLEPVSQVDWIKIFDLTGYKKNKKYGKNFVPEGPILIEHP